MNVIKNKKIIVDIKQLDIIITYSTFIYIPIIIDYIQIIIDYHK